MCDFELALTNSIERSFPGCLVKVGSYKNNLEYNNPRFQNCYFHLSQIIWRQVQSNGLVNSYKTDEETRFFIKVHVIMPAKCII